jgi:hypothetical protein
MTPDLVMVVAKCVNFHNRKFHGFAIATIKCNTELYKAYRHLFKERDHDNGYFDNFYNGSSNKYEKNRKKLINIFFYL